MNTNNNIYTVVYSTILVVLVAAILAFAAESLKPKQEENIKLETVTKVLSAAAQCSESYEIGENNILSSYAATVADAFYVNGMGEKVGESLNLGKDNVNDIQVATTSFLKKQNDLIKKIENGDTAKLEELQLPVYVFNIDSCFVTVIPCYGAGLWGPVWGYLAFENDYKTFAGAIFDHKSETPGLGAKITESDFYGQFKGRSLNDEGGFGVIKGGAKDVQHEVDAISGATITSQAVGKTINTWIKYYLPFFEKQVAVLSVENSTKGEVVEEATEAELVEQTEVEVKNVEE